MTNEDLLKNYKIYLKIEKGLSDATLKSYFSDLEDFLSYIEKDIQDIFLEDYFKYIDVLQELQFQKSSLARRRSSIRSFFRFLDEEEYIINLDWNMIPEIRYNNHIPDVLSVDEMLKLLDEIPMDSNLNIRNKVMLELLYATGIRVSELISLSIHNIKFSDNIIHIIGKGKKHRYIPISESMIQLLSNYLSTTRLILKHDKQNDFVFLNKFGNKLSRMGIWKVIKMITLRAGISKKVSPHVFRHSFATHLLEGGANLRVVQILLGHTSINTTQIYTNIDTKHLLETHRLYHPRSKTFLTHK